MNYEDFLKQKDYVLGNSGFNIDKDKLNSIELLEKLAEKLETQSLKD